MYCFAYNIKACMVIEYTIFNLLSGTCFEKNTQVLPLRPMHEIKNILFYSRTCNETLSYLQDKVHIIVCQFILDIRFEHTYFVLYISFIIRLYIYIENMNKRKINVIKTKQICWPIYCMLLLLKPIVSIHDI